MFIAQGWNDVSFHGSDELATPNIDALAYNGIILLNGLSASFCCTSPTTSAAEYVLLFSSLVCLLSLSVSLSYSD